MRLTVTCVSATPMGIQVCREETFLLSVQRVALAGLT